MGIIDVDGPEKPARIPENKQGIEKWISF